MALGSIEATESGQIELPFYLSNRISLLYLEMFHYLSPKKAEETLFDYTVTFDEGWRFSPIEENLLFSRENNPEKYYLLIYCQVSGTKISCDEKPYRVVSEDESETLLVCKAVKDWLISKRGWKEIPL